MITVEGVARKLDPEIDFWAVSKPEIEKWLKDELGVMNRLKQTQESLQSIARRVPDLPDFINRADAAFDIIVNKEESNKTSDNSKIYFLGSGVVLLVFIGLIVLI
jgi:ubiquinone biosynthesis protein